MDRLNSLNGTVSIVYIATGHHMSTYSPYLQCELSNLKFPANLQ